MPDKKYIYKSFQIKSRNWDDLADKLNVLGVDGWKLICSEQVGYNSNQYEEKIDPVNGVTFELILRSQQNRTNSDIGHQALVTYTKVLCLKEIVIDDVKQPDPIIEKVGLDTSPSIKVIKPDNMQEPSVDQAPIDVPDIPAGEIIPESDPQMNYHPSHYVEGYKNPAVILSDVGNVPMEDNGYKFGSQKFDITFIIPHVSSRKTTLLEIVASLAGRADLPEFDEKVDCSFQVFIICDNLGIMYTASLANEILQLLQVVKESRNQSKTIKNRPRYVFHIADQIDVKGGFGYGCRNWVKNHPDLIDSDYVAFIDDDDHIDPRHPYNIQKHIHDINSKNRKASMIRFNTQIRDVTGLVTQRTAQGTRGQVGHSEMVIAKDAFINLKDQNDQYGHDWDWHQQVALNSPDVHNAGNTLVTYTVIAKPK